MKFWRCCSVIVSSFNRGRTFPPITLCVLYGFQTTRRRNPVKTDEFHVLELRMIPWGLIRVGGASLWTTKATFRAGFGSGKKL